MGMNTEIYVGAYLKIIVKKAQDSPAYICVDHPNKTFWETGFCQKCGKALTETPPQFSPPHISDLIPNGEDEFYQPSMDDKDHIFLLCNLYSKTAPCNADTCEIDEIEITPHIIEEFVQNFMTIHKKSIAKLRTISEHISVRFGVVQYYN